MQHFKITAFDAGRPLNLTGCGDVVSATNMAVAYAKAARRVKALWRRGTMQSSIRVDRIKGISKVE